MLILHVRMMSIANVALMNVRGQLGKCEILLWGVGKDILLIPNDAVSTDIL